MRRTRKQEKLYARPGPPAVAGLRAVSGDGRLLLPGRSLLLGELLPAGHVAASAREARGDCWPTRFAATPGPCATWPTPPGSRRTATRRQAYFDEKIRNNLAHRSAAMYGPPEFNRIGAWGLRTVADARIQNPANPRWIITAPWEEDYLLWSLHHLVELGYARRGAAAGLPAAAARGNLLTMLPTTIRMLATPYRMVVGEQAAGRTGRSFTTTGRSWGRRTPG